MSRTRNRSQELYNKASRLMPGGVSSPVRAFRSVGGIPVYFRDATGSHFRDEDGNKYVDYCMSWGPLILGHGHPKVVEAVRDAAGRGLSYGACCRKEVDLAERVLQAFPSMDQVRFVNSGTEAVMTAVRLARGVTGRSKILKFEGGYHGHSDSLLVKAGSGLATFGISSSLGVMQSLASETVVCPLDDEESLDKCFEQFGSQLAAVIVESLPANNGLLEQRNSWFTHVRELCTRHKTLLVLDEVITGFRFRMGGYGDMLDMRADLITLGKIIGGGMPIGALIGPKDIMEQLAPLGGVYQAGTLSGNPVSLAAGLATLEALSDGDMYGSLERLGRLFDRTLQEEGKGIPFLKWRRVGSLIWLHLAESELPRKASDVCPEACERFNRMYPRLLEDGIYFPPSAYEVAFLSVAHSAEEVHDLARRIAELAAELSDG